MTNSAKAARDTALVVLALTLVVAGSLVAAWVTDFAPDALTFNRLISAILLGGFGLLLSLFVVLVAVLRSDHYARRIRSPLHLPLIVTVGALTIYFGIASISALNVFWSPQTPWPLLRDPGIRLVAAALVFAIIVGPAWLLVEVLRGRNWLDRQIAVLYAIGVALTAAVIWIAIELGSRV